MKKTFTMLTVSFLTVVSLLSCSTIPPGAVAVKPFETQRYLGKWYEIARMDFRFERNLINVTADYSMNKNGTIRVVNRGFNEVTREWKQAVGKAKLSGNRDEGRLKVSFFGPFYSGYNVIALDDEYKYALVAGANLKYLWILSREKTIPEEVKKSYLEKARSIGYDPELLIFTPQE
jgi:apolipoprotein D and lipocalin family protein